MKAIFLSNAPKNIKKVYNEETAKKLPCSEIFSGEDIITSPEKFSEVEYIFSTWGMPELSVEQIKACLPKLKCIFYAAGTVQKFARPFLECGTKIFSAWAANAIPVAEYTLAQILLANKGFFPLSAMQSRGEITKAKQLKSTVWGNFNTSVGIIGAGMIGKKVIELLSPFELNILVFDPFLPDATAAELGVKKASLEEIFTFCSVVSNHLADNENTRGILNYELFSKMQENAVFINTGRGAQVVEADLARLLFERPDVYALLDVTFPEPPEPDHEFYRLENCILTPHIAGSLLGEMQRMGNLMLEEYKKFEDGQSSRCEVTLKMLETMA